MSESAAFCQIIIQASSLVVFYVLKDLKERERSCPLTVCEAGAVYLLFTRLLRSHFDLETDFQKT